MAAMQRPLKRTIAIAKLRACFSSLRPAAAADIVASPPPQLPPFDHQPHPYNGPSADEVFAKRKTFLGPSVFHYYKKPVSLRNQHRPPQHPRSLFCFLLFICFRVVSMRFRPGKDLRIQQGIYFSKICFSPKHIFFLLKVCFLYS